MQCPTCRKRSCHSSTGSGSRDASGQPLVLLIKSGARRRQPVAGQVRATGGRLGRSSRQALDQGVEQVRSAGGRRTRLRQVRRLSRCIAAALVMVVMMMDRAGLLGRTGLSCRVGLRRSRGL